MIARIIIYYCGDFIHFAQVSHLENETMKRLAWQKCSFETFPIKTRLRAYKWKTMSSRLVDVIRMAIHVSI